MGQMTVTRSKDCAGYKWNIRWESGGDKEQLSIVKLNIIEIINLEIF